MAGLRLERTNALPLPAARRLAAQARTEGHRFLDVLVEEWISGENRFSLPAEAFFVARAGSRLVATCGLNRDPWAGDARVGRLRRLYVAPDWRRRGIARLLTWAALCAARGHFDSIRLRTFSSNAPAFYQHSGFRPAGHAEATHEIDVAH